MHSPLPTIIMALAWCLVMPECPGERVMLGLGQGSAHALPMPGEISVRPKVVANGKRLSLLDFCESDHLPEEWKALLAEVDVGPAPEAGRESSLKSQQIARHFERFLSRQGLDPKTTVLRLPERITVASPQATVTREQIEEFFREFVLEKTASRAEQPEDLVIGQISFGTIPALPVGQLRVEVTASPHERFMGDATVMIHFHVDGREVRNMRVSGKIEYYRKVIYSARAMKRNEVLTDADIQSIRVNIADRPDRYLTQREQVIGKKLLNNVGPNQPLNSRDLDQPSLVKRGDPVTIIFQQEGIRLSTRGESKENGSQGDRIRIRNVDSKKNILCQVIDAQTVEVLP